MAGVDRNKLSAIEVFLAERNDEVRRDLRSALRAAGFKQVRAFSTVEALVKGFDLTTPDYLIVSADLGRKVFPAIRDIREHNIGRNPFLMMTLLLGDDARVGVVRRALSSGADDIILGGVVPGDVLRRIEFLVVHRPLFIATADYLGPERRQRMGRKSDLPYLNVVNTMRDKIEGRRVSRRELDQRIRACISEAMVARLESQGRKLGWACNHIVNAYENAPMDDELKKYLAILAAALQGAARTAAVLREDRLYEFCTKLAQDVTGMARNYKDIKDQDIRTIRTLLKAYDLAKGPRKRV